MVQVADVFGYVYKRKYRRAEFAIRCVVHRADKHLQMQPMMLTLGMTCPS